MRWPRLRINLYALPYLFVAGLLAAGAAEPVAADTWINSGGPATGSYLSDRNFSGGSAYTWGNQSGVYNTERWSSAGFSYAIPATPGQVEVTLRFRESCTQCPYLRVFQVTAEGQVVLANFSVPLNTVGDRTFTVTTDATLNLVFATITGESWVNAIEVRQLSTAPTVTLSANPSSMAPGGTSTLSWNSTNAASCTASGAWSGARTTVGSEGTGALAATSVYTLTCDGAGGSATQSVTVTVAAPDPPPAVTLSASPAVVTTGGSSTLTWSATNATSCVASDAWTGPRSVSGSESTGPLSGTTPYTYTLSCTGAGGTTSRSVTVTVAATVPPPTVTLSANPTSVASGGTSILNWSSTHATSCTASGAWSGAKPTSGSQTTASLTSSRTYTLTCTGAGGSAGQSVRVTVVPRPTVTLSASPTSVVSGGASTLTWSSTNATSCTASGAWSGAKPTSGTQSTGPLSAARTYTLSCTGIGGSRSRSVTVGITLPATVTLSATPSAVSSGGSAILAWSSTNAVSCTASGAWSGVTATSGSQSTGPLSATSLYTLTCSNSASSAISSAIVNVSAGPTVSLNVSPIVVASGGSATLTWSSTNATSCTAGGAWSGAVATAGSQSTGPVTAASTFSLTCSGPEGFATTAVNLSVLDPNTSAVFPLRVEPGKRYLVDAQGKPFLIHGDTAWSLIAQLTREEVDQYLEDRRQKGFNAILVNLIEHAYAANPPLNRYGDAPFTTAGDFATPGESYFAHADYVIAKAAEKGILVMLAPAYAGCCGDGWWQEMQGNGAIKLRGYGQYLGNRYRSYPNILWVHGGDTNVPSKDLVRALAAGIRDVETTSLHTYHGSRGTGAFEFFGTAEPWLTVNNIYTDNSYVVTEAYQEFSRSSAPFFLIEAVYENEGIDDRGVRTQAYQAVFSGAGGHLMGNNPIWFFNAPSASNPTGQSWQAALNSGGARSMQKMRELLGAYPWWKLAPDVSGSFVTSGVQSGGDRTAGARAEDGSFAMIYLVYNHSVTVNTSLLAGPKVSARWCDPVSAVCSAIPGSPFIPSISQTFVPAGSNSGGDGDWVLLLEAVP